MRIFGLVLVVLAGCWAGAAHACNTPNPNLLAPPFVDGCNVPAVALNNLAAGLATKVSNFGAVCDGVTDDGAKLQAAFSSGNSSIAVDAKICRSSIALTIPDYMNVVGLSFEPNTYGTKGSVIQCDATVTGSCVTMGNGDNKPSSLTNVTISRGAGVIPTGAGCVTVSGGLMVYITHVECYNHAKGFILTGDGVSNGIYYFLNSVNTCRISGSHTEINSVPGVYFDHPVFGCVGGGALGDAGSNQYVRIDGNFDNVKGTIHFIEAQFNNGQLPAALCAININTLTGTTNVLYDLEIIGGHTEVAQQWLCTDSSVKGLAYFQVLGHWAGGGWGGPNALFAMNPATTPFQWTLTGDHFSGWTSAALAPTLGFDDVKITGTSFPVTPVGLTAGASNSLNMDGNEYQGLSIAGNWQGPGSRITGLARAGGGAYSYSFTGNLQLDVTNESLAPCTAALAFSGGSGLTQTLNSCKWQINGSYVDVTLNITVTGMGSSSGTASLTGLPQPANATDFGMSPCYNVTAAGLSTATNSGFYANPVGTTANLFTQAATSIQPLTTANFGAGSNFSCSLRFPLSS